MNDKYFIDTNILVYLYSIDQPDKRHHLETIFKSVSLDTFLISTQVINEFINVLYKKKIPWSTLEKSVNEILHLFNTAQVTKSTIAGAMHIAAKYQFSILILL